MTRVMNMTAKVLCMLLFLAGGTASALAVDTGLRPNAAEIMRLPPYCQAKFNAPTSSPEWKAWRAQIGQNFIDLHHYCAGLNYMNRYWGARSAPDRSFYLQRALTNFDYMVKAEKPDFALRVELYSQRGEVNKLLRKPGEAINDFNKAVSIDPKAVKPYLQLADTYVATKASARALEAVTEGLRQVPDSTALQRRYLELGGKKPFPAPVAAQAAEPAAAPGGQLPAPEVEPAAVEAKPAPAAPAEAAPVIGTPKNPYCRFCPPE